ADGQVKDQHTPLSIPGPIPALLRVASAESREPAEIRQAVEDLRSFALAPDQLTLLKPPELLLKSPFLINPRQISPGQVVERRPHCQLESPLQHTEPVLGNHVDGGRRFFFHPSPRQYTCIVYLRGEGFQLVG